MAYGPAFPCYRPWEAAGRIQRPGFQNTRSLGEVRRGFVQGVGLEHPLDIPYSQDTGDEYLVTAQKFGERFQ